MRALGLFHKLVYKQLTPPNVHVRQVHMNAETEQGVAEGEIDLETMTNYIAYVVRTRRGAAHRKACSLSMVPHAHSPWYGG